VLSATAGAEVATGLKLQMTTSQLRASVEDGSIADLVQWRGVVKGDTVFVPAGTIHSAGPGLVLAEIQQRSDVTYRLFDYDRHRELQVDNALSVAVVGPAEPQPARASLANCRILLVADLHFVLERVELPPDSNWSLNAKGETWFLVLEGTAQVGPMRVSIGEAAFLEGDRANIIVGPEALVGLLAYLGPHADADILHYCDGQIAVSPIGYLPRLVPRPRTGMDPGEVQS
jgi:mannose-6-phosphate isomerase